MGYLLQNFWWPCLLIAALIGLLTGWWIWYRRSAALDYAVDDSIVTVPEPPAPPAEPVRFAEPVPEPIAVPPAPVPEPIAVPAAPVAAAVAASSFLAAPDGAPDDLRQIKGIGPKLNELLNGLGVFHFRQIAAWTGEQIAEVDSHLANFKGRIVKDRWVDQARYLAAGDIAGFEAEFGSIEDQI